MKDLQSNRAGADDIPWRYQSRATTVPSQRDNVGRPSSFIWGGSPLLDNLQLRGKRLERRSCRGNVAGCVLEDHPVQSSSERSTDVI
jgi:hypothetical protein